MTQHPQREYIITEEQLQTFGVTQKEIDEGTNFADRLILLKAIRSRPHTPAPEYISSICDRCNTGEEPFCIGCDRLVQHDTAIARAATLAAYEEAIAELTVMKSEGFQVHHKVMDIAINKIRTLHLRARQSTTAAGDPK